MWRSSDYQIPNDKRHSEPASDGGNFYMLTCQCRADGHTVRDRACTGHTAQDGAVYVATTSKEALSAMEKGQKVRCGREVVHKIADALLEMESVGHRVTVFLVPCDKGIRGVAEAKQAATSVSIAPLRLFAN